MAKPTKKPHCKGAICAFKSVPVGPIKKHPTSFRPCTACAMAGSNMCTVHTRQLLRRPVCTAYNCVKKKGDRVLTAKKCRALAAPGSRFCKHHPDGVTKICKTRVKKENKLMSRILTAIKPEKADVKNEVKMEKVVYDQAKADAEDKKALAEVLARRAKYDAETEKFIAKVDKIYNAEKKGGEYAGQYASVFKQLSHKPLTKEDQAEIETLFKGASKVNKLRHEVQVAKIKASNVEDPAKLYAEEAARFAAIEVELETAQANPQPGFWRRYLNYIQQPEDYSATIF